MHNETWNLTTSDPSMLGGHNAERDGLLYLWPPLPSFNPSDFFTLSPPSPSARAAHTPNNVPTAHP